MISGADLSAEETMLRQMADGMTHDRSGSHYHPEASGPGAETVFKIDTVNKNIVTKTAHDAKSVNGKEAAGSENHDFVGGDEFRKRGAWSPVTLLI